MLYPNYKHANKIQLDCLMRLSQIPLWRSSGKAHKKISKDDANKLIKNLLHSKENNIDGMKNAFIIYSEMNEPDHMIINNLLRLCLLSKQPERALNIWKDIKYLSSKENNIRNIISLNMSVLDCCLKSNKVSALNCIEILKYLVSKTKTLQLKMHGNSINKLIKKCNNNELLLKYIHSLIDNGYFVGNTDIIKTALINAYGECCNDIKSVLTIFNSIDNQNDIISIGSMMKVLINNSCYQQALHLYDKTDDALNNEITHLLAIKACKGINNYDKGIDIIQKHEERYCHDMFIKTTIIDFYGHFGDIYNALKVFDDINNNKKSTANINAMMTAFIENKDNIDALELYDRFNLLHNGITDMLAIKACKNINNMRKGVEIHSQIKDINNIRLMNILIDFYGHFGYISNVYHVFDSISDINKDNATIATMMNVCINNKESKDALQIYMKYNDLLDGLCHILAVKACSDLKDYETGNNIIDNFIGDRFDGNIDLQNTLIHFYGNSMEIEKAKERFDRIIPNKLKNIQTITVMMEAYCKNDLNNECIELFNNIKTDYCHLKEDIVWYNIAIKACTQGTLLHFGVDIHSNLEQWMLNDTRIQINLLNMYGKCAMLNVAQSIFNNAKIKNVDIYNGMIHVYGRNGKLMKAMELFHIMNDDENIIPDRKTFILLINACSHCGDVEKARDIWENKIIDQDIKYDIYVMTAFIDCMARKGYLNEAKQFIIDNDLNQEIIWIALLSGCTKHHNINMAQEVHKEMNKRFGTNTNRIPTASTLLANL